MKFQRIYLNKSLGKERLIDPEQIIFLQVGDKVPGEFVDFHLICNEALPNKLFEVVCRSDKWPGFVYKVVAIPKGAHINEMVVVED